MNTLPKRIHVIGICGVATSALAIALHNKGVVVTGSDKGFFPPVSTELEKHGVSFYAGWHPELMIKDGVPDAVIIGTASGSHNPETLYATEHKIPMYSFAKAIGEFFAQENSIVCVGTWGKTSSTALLSYILEHAEFNPTYMFGGVSLSHESSAKLTNSPWSIFEGDEYKSGPTDPTPKFAYYKPTHLLLTAVSWDHADLYPTEQQYFAAFDKLISTLSPRGFVIACGDHIGALRVLNTFTGRKVLYGREGTAGAQYTYSAVMQSKDGIDLEIQHDTDHWHVHSPMLGAYQAENITGCFAFARELGIPAEKILEAIASFKGLKRRLEKRLDGEISIIDDIAHSPEKASTVLATLRQVYEGKIITVFEPNIGGRAREAIIKYNNAFKNSDIVIIPRLTKLKVAENGSEQPMDGVELTKVISQTHQNTAYIDSDTELVTYLQTHTKKGDCIAFLGSHGFRGMIEESVKLQSNPVT